MPFMTPLENVAARVTFKLVQDLDGEVWQMGVGTGMRHPADVADLLAAAEGAFDTNVIGLIEHSHHVSTTYSEWSTAGFTGFHQTMATSVNVASNTGNQLPPQCACVLSLRNDDENLLPIRRRRGRIFHGMIPVSFTDANGRMIAADAQAIRDAWKTVDVALRTVPPLADALDCPGFGIVSQAANGLFDATVIGVGVGVDTQRRRRRKVVESIDYVSLP